MELKTYQGKSMAEALEKVKQDLGRGAVILHTRTIRRGGLMGVGARSIVEITASKDLTLLPRPEGSPGRGTYVPRRETLSSRTRQAEASSGGPRSTESAAANRGAASSDTLAQISSSTSALRSEMEELRTMVRQLLDREQSAKASPGRIDAGLGPVRPGPPIPEELQEYYTKLIQNAVADELAREVVSRAKERLNEWRARLQAVGPVKTEPLDFQKLIPDALLEVVERMLPTADPVQLQPGRGTKFVALVGPTGVGKTTTIAKLAAQFKLRDRKRVGLITTDTYRIAAVAQLKAYADILSVPLEVVYTPDELAETMRKMQGFDVVLIDTSGRSQKDTEHLGDLQAFLEKARETAAAQELEATAASGEGQAPQPTAKDGRCSALETHLVLSCTAHSNQLQQVLEKFSRVGVDRVVFTKLDEAVGVGVILNIAHRLDVQLSYLTTGQDVPDDIEVGSRRRLAELVLNLPSSTPTAAPASSSAAEPSRVASEPVKKSASAINQLA
ncbi:MAG TPA: flagellar biosynthesis protein FlhF [Phycisphaerae bacterium]|nr:flagellar biosynthesis protein FlhF [Phycisphaerae bacterium]HOM51389.1 flagellar biosynthesis protein FlhF [Phycisphaerae bacterium]HPP26648.1 flagellar biosynthesis protein FlhF [Phycisphaerae bacterium]HPU25974.1 flagellar biosynthesis protein FlhF [Phycisphaerae bacterium]HPZ97365.1 flagellar biosynthesis protein FlhF [Phycisphaerae bacterium]